MDYTDTFLHKSTCLAHCMVPLGGGGKEEREEGRRDGGEKGRRDGGEKGRRDEGEEKTRISTLHNIIQFMCAS